MSFPPPTQGQARAMWLALTGLSFAILTALIVVLIWGIGRVVSILAPVLWPLAVAGVLAYLLDPVVDYVESKGPTRPRAIICVFALAAVLICALFGSVVPQLVNETRQLAARVPEYAVRIKHRIEDWATHPPPFIQKFIVKRNPAPAIDSSSASTNQSPADPVLEPSPSVASSSTNSPALLMTALDKSNLEAATAWLASAAPRVGSWLFGQVGRVASWFGVLAGLALVPVYAFYFLLEKRGISSRWTNYLPVTDSGFKQELIFVLNSVNNYLIAFFRGQVLVAICDGVLYTIGFLIIGLPYAILLGAIAIFLTMIPFLGAIFTCVSAFVIALVQYGDWQHPLLVLAVFAVVQALEGLVISPKIMGDRVGLHPVTIIIAVITGTTLLGGILGGILAIPLTAALRVVMFRYIWKRSSTSE
jgi:predicted PurR-regulated permease PerM